MSYGRRLPLDVPYIETLYVTGCLQEMQAAFLHSRLDRVGGFSRLFLAISQKDEYNVRR